MELILASTSPYRARLLSQLQLPFSQIDPAWPELAGDGELPSALCRRLARGKAVAVAEQQPRAPWLIIGLDQVAFRQGEIFGKPGTFDRAFEQLSRCSGQWVTFETGLALVGSDGSEDVCSETYEVKFRPLDHVQIKRYLEIEQPFDCAGSIRAEGLGVALIEDTRGRDINTLLGLPLMLLQDRLLARGLDLLSDFK